MTRLARLRAALITLAFSSLPAFAAEIQVGIFDDEFIPKNITVAPGDKVTWTNIGGGPHTVTADDGTFDSTGTDITIPPDGKFSYTFTETRKYPYFCANHGGPNGQGMSGTVRVADVSANHPPATPTNTTPAGGAPNQSVSPTLIASAFLDQDADDIHLSSQWIIREVASGQVALDTGETTTNKTSLKLADLDHATAYAWKVRYRDDLGGWSAYSAETQFTTVADQGVGGAGLTATYGTYNVKTQVFASKATQVDPQVNFDWKIGKPQAKLPADNFLVRWEGKVLPGFSERYRFRVRADGGVRLWVNDVLLIDDWVITPFPVYRNRVLALQAGVPAKIKLEYFDGVGPAAVSLRWSSPSQATEVIPQSQLFPLAN